MVSAATAVYSAENVARFWPDAEAAVRAHALELEGRFAAPDMDFYRAAEAAGTLRIFTARADSEIAGYAIFFVNRSPHYRAILEALADVFYVEQSARRGRIGTELLEYAEFELAREGVFRVFHHVKTEHPALGVLLERRGFNAEETVYSKIIACNEDVF